jgi:hypothetical protein
LFKIEFCSKSKKNQNKNLFNPKSEQILKYKIVQISEKKIEKSRKNREKAPHGLAQQENYVGGAN